MSLFYPLPSPVPSFHSTSSDEHSDTVSNHSGNGIYSPLLASLLKPEPIKPNMDYALQLAQLQFLWQPMTNFLAMCQYNQKQQFSPLSSFEPVPSRKRAQQPSVDVLRKPKMRKLEDTVEASPVNGMFIKDSSSLPSEAELQRSADTLDETAAYVEISEESRRKINEIEDVIGECKCCLCKVKYDDVFKLAQHRCPRIAHEEYKCPECDKTFSCPANLASHRRWHRPREATPPNPCGSCGLVFSSKKQFKSHLAVCQSSIAVGSLFSGMMPKVEMF